MIVVGRSPAVQTSPFVLVALLQFSSARQIIAAFPGLLRPASPYQVHASEVVLPPVTELVKNEAEMATARKALAQYLLDLRGRPMPREWRPDVDTALVMVGTPTPIPLKQPLSLNQKTTTSCMRC